MIHVIALITTKPGKREEVLQAFRANVPNVRAEKGCIEYGAAIDSEPAIKIQTALGPDTFMVVEKYQSLDALKEHAGSAHMAAYAAKTKDMVASRTIHILTPT